MYRRKSIVSAPLTVLFILLLLLTLGLFPSASFAYGRDAGGFTGSVGTGSVEEGPAVKGYPERASGEECENAGTASATDTYEPNDSFEEAYGPLLSGQVYQ